MITTEKSADEPPLDRTRPVHPGEVLREDFLIPLHLSVSALAIALGVPAKRIHKIVKARRGVSTVTAARLAKYFGGDAASWLVLQANYDLKTLPTQGEIERMVHARERLAVRARVEAAMNTPHDID